MITPFDLVGLYPPRREPLGPPARCPLFYSVFCWEGSSTKIDDLKKRGFRCENEQWMAISPCGLQKKETVPTYSKLSNLEDLEGALGFSR